MLLIYLLFIYCMQVCHGDGGPKMKGGATTCDVSYCVVSIVLLIVLF